MKRGPATHITLTEIDWTNGNEDMPKAVRVPIEHTGDEESIREYLVSNYGDDTEGYVGN